MRRMETARHIAVAAVLVGVAGGGAAAQDVSFERLRAAAEAPADWLTYSGGYFSQRYSELDQVTAANVRDLQLQWVYQTPVFGPWQSTPLVVDGVMYLTQRPNDVVALDARTGRVFWVYSYATPPDHRACCGSNNRGVAILGNRVFMATLDAHVVALDAATGVELWDVELADRHLAYSFTLAPLVVEDKVIIGSAGGDRGNPRLHHGAGRGHRGGGVALPHHTGAGRAGGTRRGRRVHRIRRRTAIPRPGCTAGPRRG